MPNCDWMSASYTSGQSSYSRWHPTFWASSQRSVTVSSTPCHGAWTSAPLSLHRFTELDARRLKWKHPFVPAAQQLTSSCHDYNNTRAALAGRITDEIRSGWRTQRDTLLSLPTIALTILNWPFWEQNGSSLTASAPVSDVSATGYTNGVWLLLRLVSVAQKNILLTMLSSNVQSIDLPWSARPDGFGRWDNWMAAHQLSRNRVRLAGDYNK